MKVSRLAAVLAVVLIPAGPAFASNTSDIEVNASSVLPSLGVTIDLVGDSALPLGRHVSVRGGLGSVSVHSARGDDRDANSNNSPIRASASGLLLGLDLIF